MPKSSPAKFFVTLFTTLSLTVLMILITITFGTYDLSINDVFHTLFRINPTAEHDLVVFDFRLPRILIAGAIGFGLGTAGAVLQGITRNGLADPGILGINAGAGAAIVLFMFFFQTQLDNTGWKAIMMMPLFGLIGGLGAAFIIYLFSYKNSGLDSQRLLLTGIAIGSGFSAFSLYLSLKMKASDFEMAAVWVQEVFTTPTGSTFYRWSHGSLF